MERVLCKGERNNFKCNETPTSYSNNIPPQVNKMGCQGGCDTLSETVRVNDFKGFFILDALYHEMPCNTTQNRLPTFHELKLLSEKGFVEYH